MRITTLTFDYANIKQQIKKSEQERPSKNIRNVRFKSYPPSEAQLKLIENLKEKLESNGHDTSFLVDVVDSRTAWHVSNTLIRLCKKYKL